MIISSLRIRCVFAVKLEIVLLRQPLLETGLFIHTKQSEKDLVILRCGVVVTSTAQVKKAGHSTVHSP